MSGIRLSEKHGVNPSVLICPVCKKSTGVALLGRIPGDKKAPRQMYDQSLCKECIENMSKGVAFLEYDGEHYTGSYFVISEADVQQMFKPGTKIEKAYRVLPAEYKEMTEGINESSTSKPADQGNPDQPTDNSLG